MEMAHEHLDSVAALMAAYHTGGGEIPKTITLPAPRISDEALFFIRELERIPINPKRSAP